MDTASALTPDERRRLIELARQSVAHLVAGAEAPQPGPTEGALAQRRGAFVTLTNQGRLRGCIGTFSPRSELAQTVIDMAAEACRDPRFVWDPIMPGELRELTLEVSVLSPLTRIANPLDLQIGVQGIYVIRGQQGGCFLPEVAIDQGWDARRFLQECCATKAGLPPDAWQDGQTQVLVFTSEKFTE